MNDEFLADTFSFEEDDATVVLAFSAGQDEAQRYVVLQYPVHADEQDRSLGLDGLYIERDDQVSGCYKGVESLRRIGNRIEIDLTAEGKRQLHAKQLVIALLHWSPAIDQGLARLAELSQGQS